METLVNEKNTNKYPKMSHETPIGITNKINNMKALMNFEALTPD